MRLHDCRGSRLATAKVETLPAGVPAEAVFHGERHSAQARPLIDECMEVLGAATEVRTVFAFGICRKVDVRSRHWFAEGCNGLGLSIWHRSAQAKHHGYSDLKPAQTVFSRSGRPHYLPEGRRS